MIIFYHQTKTLIDFWYKRWLNSQISYLIIRGFTSWANWNLQEPLYCLWHKGFQNSIGTRIFSQKKKKKKSIALSRKWKYQTRRQLLKHIWVQKGKASIASSFWFTTESLHLPHPPEGYWTFFNIFIAEVVKTNLEKWFHYLN